MKISSYTELFTPSVTPAYLTYFASPSVVLSRHWRHRGDIPKELATLPRSAWDLIKSAATRKKSQPDKQPHFISLSGKQLELYTAIEVELLDISGLDKKLQDYVAQYQSNFDSKLTDLLNGLPTNQREQLLPDIIRFVAKIKP